MTQDGITFAVFDTHDRAERAVRAINIAGIELPLSNEQQVEQGITNAFSSHSTAWAKKRPSLKGKLMRNLLLFVCTASSALAIAVPAAAQYAPARQVVYGQNYGQVRSLQVRIDAIQRQIDRLDRRNILSNREARELRTESREVENRLHIASRNRLTRTERYNVERRIARLEQRVQREANDRDRRVG